MTRCPRLEPYLEVYSKFDRFQYGERFEISPSWRAWYEAMVKCPECPWPNRVWQERPLPLDVELEGSFPGVTTYVLGCVGALIRDDLCEVLEPYLPPVVLGRCRLRSGQLPLPFRTVQAAKPEQVNPYRGSLAVAAYRQCGACGRISSGSVNPTGIVERDLRGRPIVVDEFGRLYIRRNLSLELRLRERFDDIRFHRVPIIPEPLDGYTLPGDPDWDGVLRLPKYVYIVYLGLWLMDERGTTAEQEWIEALMKAIRTELETHKSGQLLEHECKAGYWSISVIGRDADELVSFMRCYAKRFPGDLNGAHLLLRHIASADNSETIDLTADG